LRTKCAPLLSLTSGRKSLSELEVIDPFIDIVNAYC
jgi:hypothetical protein